LLRLTLDLMRRRLAEVGAVDVVKGAAYPPTPGAEALAYRRQRGGICLAREEAGLGEAEVVNWTGPSC
jgi:hypothetical protein